MANMISYSDLQVVSVPVRLIQNGQIVFLESLKLVEEQVKEGIVGLKLCIAMAPVSQPQPQPQVPEALVLPAEIQFVILSKGEPETALKLRAVCKLWGDTVDYDPTFLKSQVEWSVASCRRYLVQTFSMDIEQMFWKIYHEHEAHQFNKSSEIVELYPASLMNFLGSNNGVIILSKAETLLLWNASIHKCLKLENKGKFPLTGAVGFDMMKTVFVGVFRDEEQKLQAYVVYLETKKWVKLTLPGLNDFNCVLQKNVFIKKTFYFLGGKEQMGQTGAKMLLSLDIEKKSLKVIDLPEHVPETDLLLGEFRENFAIFAIQREKIPGTSNKKLQECRVWIRGKDNESWKMILSIDLNEAPNSWEFVCVGLSSLLMVNETSVCVYNLESDDGFQEFDIQGCRDVYAYPHSLFLNREGVDPSEYDFDL